MQKAQLSPGNALKNRVPRLFVEQIPRGLVLLFWSLIVCIPLLAVISVALKTRLDLLQGPLSWPKMLHWENFALAWERASLGQALLNSALVTGSAVLGIVLVGAAAAYPIARRTGPTFNLLYLYFFAGIILPGQFALFTLYSTWTQLGLVNTLLGVILCSLGSSLPFVVFLYVGFIKTIPLELEEAATIDGAGPFRTFWTIVFPLLAPATATVIITSGLSVWNDLFYAVTFLQDQDKQTLPLAIYSFVGQYGNDWTLLMASVIVSSLPVIVVFLFLQRYFVQGLTGGALRS